jgi:hypothetical protein
MGFPIASWFKGITPWLALPLSLITQRALSRAGIWMVIKLGFLISTDDEAIFIPHRSYHLDYMTL